MRRIIIGLISFVLLLIGLALAAVNNDPVRVDYYLGSANLSLALTLVLALLIGALLGIVVSLGLITRLKLQNMRLRRSLHRRQRDASTPISPATKPV